MTAAGYAAGICADRIPPGRAVNRPRPGDRFTDATVADLHAVAVAADNARRRRGTLGAARSWAAAGLDDALDRLDRPDTPTAAPPAGLPAGFGTVTAEPAPAVAFRHAWSAGNRHAAIAALADLFAGTTTRTGRAAAADLALRSIAPPGQWGPT